MASWLFWVWAISANPPVELPGELIDVASSYPRIQLDLRYATARNLLGRPLYAHARCLLRPEVAAALDRVERALEREGLGLLLWDCYRPPRVQRALWRHSPRPGWVASPRVGSNHSRGTAVDVSLVSSSGKQLPMPTDFDDLSPRAAADAQVGPLEKQNRSLLQRAMRAQGFHTIRKEWWHFNASGAARFPVLEADPMADSS